MPLRAKLSLCSVILRSFSLYPRELPAAGRRRRASLPTAQIFRIFTETCGIIIKAFGPAFLERLAGSKGRALGRPPQRAKSLTMKGAGGEVKQSGGLFDRGEPSPGVPLCEAPYPTIFREEAKKDCRGRRIGCRV